MATYLGEGNSDIKPGQIGLLSRVMATHLGEGITLKKKTGVDRTPEPGDGNLARRRNNSEIKPGQVLVRP